MANHYKIPLLSLLAGRVAMLLPNRVHAWIWIAAYQDLDRHYGDVNDVRPDGSRACYSAVSAIQIENISRRIWRQNLKATTTQRVDKLIKGPRKAS